MINSYLLLILLTFLGALGSFFIKKSTMNSLGIFHSFKELNLYIGLFMYMLSAIINIYVLQLLPYIVVLPCSSITYIWSLYFARTYLKEKVGLIKITGMLFIISGAITIALY